MQVSQSKKLINSIIPGVYRARLNSVTEITKDYFELEFVLKEEPYIGEKLSMMLSDKSPDVTIRATELVEILSVISMDRDCKVLVERCEPAGGDLFQRIKKVIPIRES